MQLRAFQVRVIGRQLCAFLVVGWCMAFMCPSGSGLVVASYVPFL
jgi:hypothetical protein